MFDEAVIETDLEAPPEEVWETLTSTEGVEQWMGDGSAIGDDGDLWFRDFVTGEPREGRVRRSDPERRLEFDWWPENKPGHTSSVTITLEPLHTGTRLVVVERPGSATLSVSAWASGSTVAAWQWRNALVGVSLAPLRPSVLGAC